jgi:hypothetical protein
MLATIGLTSAPNSKLAGAAGYTHQHDAWAVRDAARRRRQRPGRTRTRTVVCGASVITCDGNTDGGGGRARTTWIARMAWEVDKRWPTVVSTAHSGPTTATTGAWGKWIRTTHGVGGRRSVRGWPAMAGRVADGACRSSTAVMTGTSGESGGRADLGAGDGRRAARDGERCRDGRRRRGGWQSGATYVWEARRIERPIPHACAERSIC